MTEPDERFSFLVVDDDDVFRTQLARALTARGHQVRAANDGETAVALARDESPERAVVDLRMPGKLGGLDVLRALLSIDATTSVVVLTGYGSIATAIEAVRLGATHYLTKPADADEILAAFTRGGGAVAETTPTLARVEWEHIHRVLSDCDGNVSEAARRLGVHRRSLQRKLAKHPVKR